jgi:branched-subunit amino acid transport protein
MMTNEALIVASVCMALLQYFMKMLPLVFLKGKIKSQFLSSFLHYVPYAVLTSIIIPEIFSSTSSVVSAVIGAIVAVILGLFDQGLIVVSLSATVAVFVTERILGIPF